MRKLLAFCFVKHDFWTFPNDGKEEGEEKNDKKDVYFRSGT